jgi:hypothetical protein
MKFSNLMGAAVALALAVNSLAAQTANNTDQVKQLQEQLKQMQEQFQQQQQLFQQQMKAMQGKIGSLQQAQTVTTDEQTQLKAMMDEKLSSASARSVANTDDEYASAPLLSKPWNPADPIRVAGNANQYVNISFDGLMTMGTSTARDVDVLQPGGHDPKQRGFTLQQAEVAFDGAVDPYFRGLANILFLINNEGETVTELEEAYLESSSLPWNLQLKVGQFFTEFGRQNPTHPHVWGFVDMPLINNRMFGGDGQRAPGARLSWLAPTPFYSELYLGLQNATGETASSFRSSRDGETAFGRLHTGNRPDRASALRDMIFTPRYQASFDISDELTLLAGASGSFGANATGADTDTQVYGLDMTWKWKPVKHEKGFPFVTWQSEAMLRRYDAGAQADTLAGIAAGTDIFGNGVVDAVPAETIEDYGFYSQVMYGFRPGWVAGFRGDYVAPTRAQYERLFGVDAARDRRWRLSPNLTHYPTEFSKVRFQYNYDWRDNVGPDHSLWLQLEFLLGAHGAHKF